MKKIALLTAACSMMGVMCATPVNNDGQNLFTDDEQTNVCNEQDLQPLSPTYLENVFGSSAWGSNWFLSVKGGTSAFIGIPQGHGDLFDRTKGVLNVAAGKWFSPFFGSRVSFQGFKLYDCEIESREYQNLHVDLLYNISSHFRNGQDELPRWDFIIYGGTGIIRNGYTHQKPFAISYGLTGRYRVTKRIHIEAELGGTTTFSDFDGYGENSKFGDNLLHLSAGLSLTMGKAGFQKVIDPKPYIFQNDLLMEHLGQMRNENDRLSNMHKKDAQSLAEMRKILEIEGLLEKYNLALPEEKQAKPHPRNNYSGLNSLRERLRSRNNGAVEEKDVVNGELATEFGGDIPEGNMSPEEYFKIMKDGKIFVGAPVFFFFKLAKDELTEKAQLINLKEVASVIKKYGLHARIVGAADSQTGTAYTNEQLSAKRADYIALKLRESGVPDDRMTLQYQGGINSYVPQEGNRNTCVMLYFK